MTYQGRSQDDLPLAAYTTGAVPDEPEEEAELEPAHLSQQDAIAIAMGMQPATATDAAAAAASGEPETKGAKRSRRPSLPKPSLPKPSLPKPSLRVPSLGRGRSAVAAEAPFRMTAQPAAGVAAQAAPATFAMPLAQAPAAKPVTTRRAGGTPGVKVGGIGTALRNPRAAVRDPRVLFGGMIAIGVVVLGVGMLGGGGSAGGVVPGASPTTGPGAGVPTVPGPATLDVTGDFTATFALTGTAPVGKPADGLIVATWADGAGSSVALTGRVGGTRTTTADLRLEITVMRNGAPVTFTSQSGECTIGMAEKMFNITGSFVCPKITSDGGRFTVKLSGTYGT